MRHRSRLPILPCKQTAIGRHGLKAVRWLAVTSMIYCLFFSSNFRPRNARGAGLFSINGNATAEGWYVADPHIVYRYYQYVVANHFTPGAEVTFSFYEAQGSTETLFQITRTADETGHVNIPVWDLPSQLVPGNYIVVSDGTTTKALVLEPVTLEVFDPEQDLLAGTTSPGEFMYVYVQNDSRSCSVDLTANESGEWTADFAAQPCDVTLDMVGAAQVFDEDSDVSEVGIPMQAHVFLPLFAKNMEL